MNSESRALLDVLSDRIPGEHLESCRSSSDAGEYAELVDEIAAIPLKRKIPVTPVKHDTLREVMEMFSQPMDGYAYLGNPDLTIAGIKVVQSEHGGAL